MNKEYISQAFISKDELYRYSLTRYTDPVFTADNTLVFIMLNPSTADANTDDPTIRKCKGFSERWGFRNFAVINLYAFRSTNPKELWKVEDPIGPQNNWCIEDHIKSFKHFICAWGNNAKKERVDEVCFILENWDRKLWCLDVNASGMPKHPLYVPYEKAVQKWIQPA